MRIWERRGTAEGAEDGGGQEKAWRLSVLAREAGEKRPLAKARRSQRIGGNQKIGRKLGVLVSRREKRGERKPLAKAQSRKERRKG